MKKGGFLRNVLDTIRSNQANQSSGGAGSTGLRPNEFGGRLKAAHFDVGQVARHGFPDQPTALAFDPVQKIAAIGTRTGAIHVFGRPGVDVWAQHKPEYAVTHIKFIINQGAIITVTADESIHLWSLRGPKLKLQLSANTGASPAPPIASASSPASGGAQAGVASTSSTSTTDQQLSAAGVDPDFLADQLTPSPTGDKSKPTFPRKPEILHTLKFQREHITYIHQTLMSKWLYIGTERGNLHVANVETFELSGYSIAWNKAIELSRKSHPGAIIHISECPQDINKLLIGYESGCIVLWDLKSKNADGRYYHADNLLWLSWHHEGKQFIAAHGDGSLITWQTRSNARPLSIVHPHSKTASQAVEEAGFMGAGQQAGSMSSTFARALNNELYRPINKVEWKTTKSSNEQFLFFSGGLPFDGHEFDGGGGGTASRLSATPSPGAPGATVPASTMGQTNASSLSGQQFLSARSSVSPGASLAGPSPISPSLSPSQHQLGDKSRQSSAQSQQHLQAHQQHQQQQQQLMAQQRKSLRPTSLTVMYGKSITVLEMDDTIIDFITVCDLSPYENDASDPYAVIVLLSKDLILIDLTSSNYPSFESPYSSATLNESPVTCVQYLADCSSDLIPYLYSASRNAVSRAPKKGFSDKEWPINGGEWGQQMQSYPELVVTGHADGTIKFWDMSGVNFDLISKIKTNKLFERPNKLASSIVVPYDMTPAQRARLAAAVNSASPASTSDQATGAALGEPVIDGLRGSCNDETSNQAALLQEENFFAIDLIEYYPNSKHLLVAGAMSQIMLFKLSSKRDPSQPQQQELAIIRVEPTKQQPNCGAFANNGAQLEQTSNQATSQQQHLLLNVKTATNPSQPAGAVSKQQARSVQAGFQPELICLTPTLVSNATDDHSSSGSGLAAGQAASSGAASTLAYYCQAPPKATALALQATHNIIAYSHQAGLVLVDIIQKCVIMNASLSEIYCGSPMDSSRDISIQPFATSSILQHHYQAAAAAAAAAPLSSSVGSSSTNLNAASSDYSAASPARGAATYNNSSSNSADIAPSSPLSPASAGVGFGSAAASSASVGNKLMRSSHCDSESYDNNDNGSSLLQHRSKTQTATGEPVQAHPKESRFTANSMFQRQLSTNALNSAAAAAAGRGSSAGSGTRLFQRQMTASQLMGGSAGVAGLRASTAASPTAPRRPESAQPSGGAPTGSLAASDPKATPVKNKRIISRMLSISAIHTNAPNFGLSPEPGPLGSSSAAELVAQGSGALGSADAGTGDQASDKLDSSFARSRSSSSSSGVNHDHHHHQSQLKAPESIQCLCFLDWTQTTSGSASEPAQAPQSRLGASQHSPSGGAGNKSLGSIDTTQAACLALWLGTSRGCVHLVALSMPDSEDNRVLQLQSVNAEPIPQAAIKLPGQILCLASFASEGRPRAPPGSSLASQSSSSLEGEASVPGASQPPPAASASSELVAMAGGSSGGAPAGHLVEGHFLAVVSEKHAKVYLLPQLSGSSSPPSTSKDHHHHKSGAGAESAISPESPLARLLTNKANCVASTDLAESTYARRSAIVQMRQPDESCLVSYMASGNILVHSLPQLRLLHDADFVPLTSPLLARSMCLSRNGHGLFRPSPTELSKFTVSAQYKTLVNEMTGLLWVARDMPEQPRANFFKSLFSAVATATAAPSKQQSDRDELFEGASNKGGRGVAKHIGAASSGLEKLKSAAVGTMGHDMRFAREGLDERGEKLNELEDKTLQMMNRAENYANAAHDLAQKFKDKKWYQF